ncbi:hypothetical protein [Streptomyces sp. NPDC001816]|uniref:hypothetical protein n=1 Tax=Streptomyces sp. NPDC001816 TaxID=3364612 RepID=UPI0036CED260
MNRHLEPLQLEGRIYSAAVPAARYIAAILPDPSTAAVGSYLHTGDTYRLRPLRGQLLGRLGALLGHEAENAENAENVKSAAVAAHPGRGRPGRVSPGVLPGGDRIPA